jgi:hypothetical protein
MKCKNAKTLGKACNNGLSMAIRCSKGIANCIRACSPKCKGFEYDISYANSVKGIIISQSAAPKVAEPLTQSTTTSSWVNDTNHPRPCCGGNGNTTVSTNPEKGE